MNYDEATKILENNRRQMIRARDLNNRAGRTVFPIFTRFHLQDFFMEQLNGATNFQEIKDGSALALPPLDPEAEAEILRGAPDTINLGGKEHQTEIGGKPQRISVGVKAHRVTYHDFGGAVSVRLDAELVRTHAWKDLPDEGVFLPNGRQVSIDLVFANGDFASDCNIPALKEKAIAIANADAWRAFDKRPPIRTPDPLDEKSEIAPIIETNYGTSVIDGSPLIGYGVSVVRHFTYSPGTYFEFEWFQQRAEAEAAYKKSCDRFAEIRRDLAEGNGLELLFTTASALQSELRTIRHGYGLQSMEPALQGKIEKLALGRLPNTSDLLRDWVKDAQHTIARARAPKAVPAPAPATPASLDALKAKFAKKK